MMLFTVYCPTLTNGLWIVYPQVGHCVLVQNGVTISYIYFTHMLPIHFIGQVKLSKVKSSQVKSYLVLNCKIKTNQAKPS